MTNASSGVPAEEAAAPPAQWLRRLWERMAAMYGNAWASAQGLAPQREDGSLTIAGETWGQALVGLGAAELGAGLSACLAEGAEFPPSAPRFRAMCLGIPTLAAVRTDIATRATPFAVKCWEFMDSHAYRMVDRREADRMLRDAYEQARDFVMRGGALPEVVAELPPPEKPKPKKASPETAAPHIAAVAEMLAAGVGADPGIEVGGTTHGKMAAAGDA